MSLCLGFAPYISESIPVRCAPLFVWPPTMAISQIVIHVHSGNDVVTNSTVSSHTTCLLLSWYLLLSQMTTGTKNRWLNWKRSVTEQWRSNDDEGYLCHALAGSVGERTTHPVCATRILSLHWDLLVILCSYIGTNFRSQALLPVSTQRPYYKVRPLFCDHNPAFFVRSPRLRTQTLV